MKIIIAAI
jgi:predicted fused transcriptional regulator/phosphomethylpyrimidine kinase